MSAATGDTVVLRGVINGFTSVGTLIGCGILFDAAAASQLFVKDTVIRGNVQRRQLRSTGP